MRQAPEVIRNFVSPIATGLGYEFVGAVFGQAESGLTLRVYIDLADGISVDDCASVSRQISAALDVEDLIHGDYFLEVSSPGLDRPLFSLADYERQIGQEIKLRMTVPHASGRRNFRGTLQQVDEPKVVLEVDTEIFELEFSDIESANVIARLD